MLDTYALAVSQLFETNRTQPRCQPFHCCCNYVEWICELHPEHTCDVSPFIVAVTMLSGFVEPMIFA